MRGVRQAAAPFLQLRMEIARTQFPSALARSFDLTSELRSNSDPLSPLRR
jgi:hypothetical protein